MEYQGIIEAIDRLSQPTWVDISALLISLSQTLILAWGLQLMRRSADHRDKQHEATMTAMDKQHEEAMTAMDKQHEEDTRRHDQTMTALRALIERTGQSPH